MQRYFAKERILSSFILNDDDYYHIKTVMRMKDNDKIYVVYDEKTYICCLENVNKNIKINIISEEENVVEIIPKVNLYVPLVKEQKMDYILQKATELGVSKIIPIITERCIIKVNDSTDGKKKSRWERIVKEASEQSHRNTIPIIGDITLLKDIKASEGLNIICSTVEKEKNIKYMLQNNKECDTINVVMGPEGGLSSKEEELLSKNGFERVTFGSRILRIETVPLFILSLINYEFME